MNIKAIAYEKYKLDWMQKHGKTISNLIQALSSAQEESGEDLILAFDLWELDCGFGGEIWACYDEFIESEYQDEYYMRSLLNDAEWDVYAGERIPF